MAILVVFFYIREGRGGGGSHVMIILLHGNHPRHVIECHGADTEVCVIGDAADFFDEAVEVRGWGAIDSSDEVGWRKAVLVGWGAATLYDISSYTQANGNRPKGTYSSANINLTMQFRNLLTNSMMRFLQDSTAEDNGATGFEILRRDSRDLNPDLLSIAHDQCVQDFLVVHDIQLGHAGDQLAIEGKDDIAFLEGFNAGAEVEGRRGTVDLADHEELMARRVGLGDLLDPFFGDAHDARLAHLDNIAFHVEDAEVRDDSLLDLGGHGEEGRGREAEMVFDIFVGVCRALAEVVEP